MKRLIALTVLLLGILLPTRAQVNLEAEFFTLPDTLTNAYLDSLKITVSDPNDYWMVGVYGGASVQYGDYNPVRTVTWQVQYPMYGFSVVRHYNMFGLFPNMGVEMGMQMNYEGYEFKRNKETGGRSSESGAYKAMITVPEAFFLSHFHLDTGDRMKILAKVGLFGGYRLKISRVLDENYVGYDVYEQYVNAFRDYDKRYTYGLQGGLGMGLMLDPFEFHLMVQAKWGWNSFWEPDYASPYHYRFGYPLDGAVTFGVYYQLTPRHGHTRAQLKKLARKMVAQELESRQ